MRQNDRIVKKFGRTARGPVASMLLGGLSVLAASLQAQTLTVLHSFAGGSGGSSPFSGVVRDAAGNLYGATGSGGSGFGTVFKLDSGGNYTVLHTFAGGPTDGSGPVGTLVLDPAGNLYGITGAGGALGDGAVFKLDPSGNLTILYSTQEAARAGLTRDAAGNLYGTTFLGGATNNGNVFKLGLDGSGNPTVYTELHAFSATPNDGNLPTAKLLVDSAGNIYGTTEHGGTNDLGVVFRIDSAGNYSVLHSFTGPPDGSIPEGSLVADSAGNLYGTTFHGGASDVGVVFKLNPANGQLTVLYNFTGGADGSKPLGDIIRDAAGNIYGATVIGGASGLGAIFKLDSSNHETVLHSFTGAPDGNDPNGELIMDQAGILYGTTLLGGSADLGAVFKLTTPPPSNNFSTFTANVVVSRLLRSTAASGEFTPANPIDPLTQTVSFSVAGTGNAGIVFPAGSFTKVLGVYAASGTSGTVKINLFLIPLSGGKWSYTASLINFLPGSASVTVGLAVGAQSGVATVNATIL
jgi:uncharacterized repeat protein (TIGR03803 family)